MKNERATIQIGKQRITVYDNSARIVKIIGVAIFIISAIAYLEKQIKD